jgi:hypothetical protein
MKKPIFLLFFFMTVLINLSIVVSSISGDVSLSGLKLRMNIANASEGEESVPACVEPGTPWGYYYYKYLDRYCTDAAGVVCGEEYECRQTPVEWESCTSICCL